MSYPLVSVIIPVKPGKTVSALECVKWLDYPEERLEVFVSEGTQPSRQRNEAARKAKGEILYFLDDDSCPVPDVLKRMVGHFEDEKVAAVGGPSITPEGDSFMQRSFGAALGSFLGGFSIRNRYRRVGKARISSENELILCNLAFRKDLFLREGGLNEKLYPNEENELMNRLQEKGYRLVHDPDAYTLRSQRKTMTAFVRQMLNYGRGRAEQTLVSPSSFRPSHLVPTIFLLYLLSTVFSKNILYLAPLGCYLLANILSSIHSSLNWREWRFLYILPPVYLIMHICYGAGVIWGFLRGLRGVGRKPRGEVVIRQVAINNR
ncbi:MAG: glycosyltransferase [Deltaproteobacteria bacterium]|nr:glycosyltransferase [Deltaproteobacteria bacterium]